MRGIWAAMSKATRKKKAGHAQIYIFCYVIMLSFDNPLIDLEKGYRNFRYFQHNWLGIAFDSD